MTIWSIKLGGLGLRKVASISVPAYYCAALNAAPDILDSISDRKTANSLLLPTPQQMQVPFAIDIESCHAALIDVGVPTGLDGFIPETYERFWQDDNGVPGVPNLQKTLCQCVAKAEYNELILLPSTSPESTKVKQRLISSSAVLASSWLTVFPTTPELTLADEDFCLAIKHRLGLPCAEDLPPKCRCETKDSKVKDALLSDPAHFHSCRKLKRTAMTVRHDNIVRILAKFFRSVDAVVRIEPRMVGFKRLIPDLEIMFPDRSLLIDVAIAHPSSPSRNSLTPLAAANSAETTKVGKYGALAAARATPFFPFILESFGAYGKQAREVLHILRTSATNAVRPIHAPSFLNSVTNSLSVALQKGNSLVYKRGAVDAKNAAAVARPVEVIAVADDDDEDDDVC